MGATGALAPARPKRQRRTRGNMFFERSVREEPPFSGGEKTWSPRVSKRGGDAHKGSSEDQRTWVRGRDRRQIPSCSEACPTVPTACFQAISVKHDSPQTATSSNGRRQPTRSPTNRVPKGRSPRARTQQRGRQDCRRDLAPRWKRKGREPSRSRATRPLRTAGNKEAARRTGRRRFINGPGRTPQSPRPP